MQSPGSSYSSRSRKSKSVGSRTPEQSSDFSQSSTYSKSSYRHRNPVKTAAKYVVGALGSCFTPPETQSSTDSRAFDEFRPTNSVMSDVSSSASSGNMHRSRHGLYSGSQNSTQSIEPGHVKFTLAEIHKATKNFSPSFKIGQGGFGTVYKGKLQDGTVVAIKRAKKNLYDKHLSVEYQSEIQMLARVEHLNLVRLFGYLEYEDERIVVVEYVPNGTLREHLDCLNGEILDLAARLDIAIDVAHAVTYLHMYTDHPIIHRDIKSSNILLTENFRAKVADFGFARLAADTDSGATHISTQVKGTAGYLDPEYLRTYQLTEKSDVYSFGVLLVELITGRRPIESKREMKERITARWVCSMCQK
ncbi:hypothetical protein GIB67_037278 [Kingdonia uniflora]|uniref:Protein kinase domain-containing protein n=1 Tax=Kingdonia uniflora TaxID=39325 RepID=A0A7J7MS24_9MAGN|nr:hypothetical protein GIB67_037278 [Kingdonia uniflora]